MIGQTRAAYGRLMGKLPKELKSDPDAIKLAAACDDRSWTIIRLINTRLSRSGLVKDYEFSRATIRRLGQPVLRTCGVPCPAWDDLRPERPAMGFWFTGRPKRCHLLGQCPCRKNAEIGAKGIPARSPRKLKPLAESF